VRKVLVTGATGFVGKAIVRACLDDGLDVVPVGNSRKREPRWPDYVRADLTERDVLSSALDGVQCVVHSAGLAHQFRGSHADDLYRRINADTVEYVALSAARAGIEHFVLISSVAVYGQGENPKEGAPCNPRGAYARSKLDGEKRAIEICTNARMRLTILRLATVYGEGDPGNVLRLMRMIDNRRFVFVGAGTNRKSLIHVHDVARACLTVVRSRGTGVQIYNVSSQPHTMREIVEAIAHAVGRRAPRVFVPPALVLPPLKASARVVRRLEVFKRAMEQWLSDDVFDASKFQTHFRFQSIVTLQEGLKREADWFRKAAKQSRAPTGVRQKT
jgi:nucleoside-diphosphate-sugar epimerase